ncbi:phage head completion protein [Celeribacter ethanolicus]|nr:head-tail adaptor protein [Celeribacter ethanolicus]
MVGRLGSLRESVSFHAATKTPSDGGGFDLSWNLHHSCRAEFIYHSGGEDTQAARFQGTQVYKIRIRSCAKARAIDTDMRMHDVRRYAENDRGVAKSGLYNIREVDAITDRNWVYIVAETGVAA